MPSIMVRVMNSQEKVWRIAPSPLVLPAHPQGGHTAITTADRMIQAAPVPGHHPASAFDPPGVDRQLATFADELVDELVDLPKVVGTGCKRSSASVAAAPACPGSRRRPRTAGSAAAQRGLRLP